MSVTLATQSRMASLMASLSVRLPAVDATHLGAEQAHAEDVERLARHVVDAHVDHALEAEQRADRGGGDAVLAGARLGDDARLAHAARQQRLAEGVVDLVGARVREVFAFEDRTRSPSSAPDLARRTGAWGADEVAQCPRRSSRRRRRDAPRVRRLERGDRRHERLGHEAPAEWPK